MGYRHKLALLYRSCCNICNILIIVESLSPFKDVPIPQE
jgi:hypothetical protein